MSSANKSTNIGLNLWQGNEYPKRQDFLDDNQIIDTEIGNLKKIAHGAVADLAALKAIDTTNLADNITIIVKTLGFYIFDSTSITTANNNSVVQPTTGPGRWLNDLASHSADYLKHGLTGNTDTGGTTTAYTMTPSPALSAYNLGLEVTIFFDKTNTGASTINISGKGAIALKKQDGSQLVTNDLLINTPYKFVYNGTNFELIGVASTDVVTVATANKILRSNAQAKLPTDITGDAASVGGVGIANIKQKYSANAMTSTPSTTNTQDFNLPTPGRFLVSVQAIARDNDPNHSAFGTWLVTNFNYPGETINTCELIGLVQKGGQAGNITLATSGVYNTSQKITITFTQSNSFKASFYVDIIPLQ